MGKLLNFDQFISEKEKHVLDVQVFGKTYKVPMVIPAVVPVMMARAEAGMDPAKSTKMIMRAADAMFGAANVDQMCRDGLGAKDLTTLIEKVFAEINSDDDEDDEAQELDDESGHVQTKRSNRAKK